MEEMKVRLYYKIESGLLSGTIIEQILGSIAVLYPHRRTNDLYIPPIKGEGWHCCQKNCPSPDFDGGIKELVEHLMLHKGKLVRRWSKRVQARSPIPAIRLPPNPWDNLPKSGCNEARQFCVGLYKEDVEKSLRNQGLEIIECTLAKPNTIMMDKHLFIWAMP